MLGAGWAKEDGMVHRMDTRPRHGYLLLLFVFKLYDAILAPKQCPLKQVKKKKKVVLKLQSLEGEWLSQNLCCEYGAGQVERTDSYDL